MSELPYCPFCGSQRVELLPNFGNRVVCNDCTAEAHIDDWKQRVISGKLLDKIREAVEHDLAHCDLPESLVDVVLAAGYTILMDYGDSNEQNTPKS